MEDGDGASDAKAGNADMLVPAQGSDEKPKKRAKKSAPRKAKAEKADAADASEST
jgi:hypothetical protein